MKTCYIMRGLPGSGKSTIARTLVEDGDQLFGIIHSTDDLRYVDGVYKFDPKENAALHSLNFNSFCDSIDSGIEVVVCDNTNIKLWEFEKYMNYAAAAGFQVVIVSVLAPADVCAARNIHSVPYSTILQMCDNYEPY